MQFCSEAEATKQTYSGDRMRRSTAPAASSRWNGDPMAKLRGNLREMFLLFGVTEFDPAGDFATVLNTWYQPFRQRRFALAV